MVCVWSKFGVWVTLVFLQWMFQSPAQNSERMTPLDEEEWHQQYEENHAHWGVGGDTVHIGMEEILP
jgi:hypothetical protein